MIQCDLLYTYTCICIKTHVWADRPATPTCSHDGRSPSAMDSSMRSPFAQRLAWTWSTAKILDLLDIWKYIHMRPHYTNFICGWIPHSLNKTWQNHIANPLPYKFFHLLCRQPHCWGIGKGADYGWFSGDGCESPDDEDRLIMFRLCCGLIDICFFIVSSAAAANVFKVFLFYCMWRMDPDPSHPGRERAKKAHVLWCTCLG